MERKDEQTNEKKKEKIHATQVKWNEWCGSPWLDDASYASGEASSGSARLNRQVCHGKCYIVIAIFLQLNMRAPNGR